MATWEDGPEYAPLERPDAFAEPSVATVTLDDPPAPPVAPPSPIERPAFADPTQAVPPLAALVPPPPAQRDPNQPFEVTSSVMTAESSAWAAAHWARQQQPSPPDPQPPPAPPQGGAFGAPQSYGSAVVPPNGSTPNGQGWPGRYPSGPASAMTPPARPAPEPHAFPPPVGAPAYPPPTGAPAYPAPVVPGQQPLHPSAPPPGHRGFPSPGTPEWFAPSGYRPPPPPPAGSPTARSVLAAATPGVVITLAVGGLIWLLAPVTLIVALALTGRMTYGRKPTRTAFTAVLAFLGLVGLLSLVTADGLFSQWWDTVAGWACFGSWVMIITTVISVYQALKTGRQDPPPMPRTTLR